MGRAKYFRFVGVLEIIAWIVGLIAFLIFLINGLKYTTVGNTNIRAFQNESIFFYVMVGILYVIVGPALGLLFFMVADLYEKSFYQNKPVVKKPVASKPAASKSVASKPVVYANKVTETEIQKLTGEEKIYAEAEKLLQEKKFDQAKEKFTSLKNYKDAPLKANNCDVLKELYKKSK